MHAILLIPSEAGGACAPPGPPPLKIATGLTATARSGGPDTVAVSIGDIVLVHNNKLWKLAWDTIIG